MPVYIATVSHFANTSANACQACNFSDAGLAWPAVSGHTPPNYAAGCFNINTLACQSNITVTNLCTGQSMSLPILDHGPGAACASDHAACNQTNYTRLADLTDAAYFDLGGKASEGIFPARITTP